MPILNYTTQIKSEKTISEIQTKLAKAGAQAILCEFDKSGIAESLSFRIMVPQGFISYKLPSNISGVLKAINKNPKVPARLKTNEQASRVAWRILKSWVEAQTAIIEAGLANLEEVFLPYAQNNKGKTLYEVLKESNFNNLITDGSTP